MSTPLTPERLAEIREDRLRIIKTRDLDVRADEAEEFVRYAARDLLSEVERLMEVDRRLGDLASYNAEEVERLRAENEALLASCKEERKQHHEMAYERNILTGKVNALRDWQKRVSDAIAAAPEVLCFCAPLPEGQVCQWCRFLSEAKEAR